MPDRGRRAYGSGSVFIRRHAYYGKWRVGGVQMQRELGPIKGPSARTASRAEPRRSGSAS